MSPEPNSDADFGALNPGQNSRELVQAVAFLSAIRQNDEIFRYAKSKATTLPKVMADIMPGVKFDGQESAADEVTGESKGWSGAQSRYHFRMPDSNASFMVYSRGNELWIDVSRLTPGEGGSAVYAAVGNHAANTGRVFIGDPEGLSPDAVIRRTHAMISLALRHGRTDFVRPSSEQIAGIPEIGVAPLQWSDNTLENLKSLIRSILATIHEQFPDIRNLRFDFERGRFVDRNSQPVDWSSLQEDLEAAHGGPRKARAGESTVRRAILIQSALQEPQDRLLRRAMELGSGPLNPESRGIF
jgi:hypothetical protein